MFVNEGRQSTIKKFNVVLHTCTNSYYNLKNERVEQLSKQLSGSVNKKVGVTPFITNYHQPFNALLCVGICPLCFINLLGSLTSIGHGIVSLFPTSLCCSLNDKTNTLSKPRRRRIIWEPQTWGNTPTQAVSHAWVTSASSKSAEIMQMWTQNV